MVVKKRQIYTYNLGLSESEFLKREFSLYITELSHLAEQKLMTSDQFYVATTNPLELRSILENCRPRSVVIFFLGNETYNVQQTQWLNQYSNKIKYAFVYNLPTKTSFKVAIKCLFAAVMDGGIFLWEGEKNIFRTFKNGIDLMKRTRKLQIIFPHHDFPQGYSKRFISEIMLKGIKLGERSILEIAPLIISEKKSKIGFVGQRGSWCRDLAIRTALKKNLGFAPVYTHGWGGINQGKLTAYIDSLIQSEFVLTPPGNLTNRNFRYLESLVFNSIPIMPPSTLQDPHLWGIWTEYSKPLSFSWKRQINRALRLSMEERDAIVSTALLREKKQVYEINKILDSLDKTKLAH